MPCFLREKSCLLISGSKVRILAHPPILSTTYREHRRPRENLAQPRVTIGVTAQLSRRLLIARPRPVPPYRRVVDGRQRSAGGRSWILERVPVPSAALREGQ